METSITSINNSSNNSNYSAEALAYLGDCALEICVREYLVREVGISSSAKLNAAAVDFVCAPRQADAMNEILDILTEEETAIFKRGRNHSQTRIPRAASHAQYRTATGMETLFGWLWLTEQKERMRELFCAAYKLDITK